MEAFRKALKGLGLKGKLIAADVMGASPSCHVADVAEIVPRAGCIEYIPSLVNIVKKHDISLVLPMTDIDIRSLARQRARFEAVDCTVMVGNEESIKLCRNKAAFQDSLSGAGLATIRTLTLEEFHSNPFYPCFIKPLRGSASVGTGLLNDDRELKAHLATFGDLMIVQEYVPGQEYTVDVFRGRDGTIHCIVPRLRMVIRSGEIEKGITIRDERIIEDTRKLSGLLGDVWGVFCCQCRCEDSGRPRFFEVNPRFGGGSPLSIEAGANLPRYVLQETLGLPIDKNIDFKDHLMMLRYDQAVFTVEKNPESLPGFNSPISK
ncbi:MAG: ATP-grasp domain-containing protein [Phycisphaerae bacterium]|jgi:carbamoyl-phosphate synthase large subunit|nr:ATP-grasp domain-containing protein [Phycisphaerae bacterium]